jgi:murein DD-endopeptidase MepM/ murein hydrolase activator NlpD
MATGKVVIASIPDGEAASFGKTIVIRHKGMLSIYTHLQEFSVKVGQIVKKGQKIGKVGKSGSAKFPQLYFSIYETTGKQRTPIDPEKFLP